MGPGRGPGTGSLNVRMFDALSDRFEGILGRLRSRGRLSEADVDAALREIRTALLEADVDVGVARSLVEGIRARVVAAPEGESRPMGAALANEHTAARGGTPAEVAIAAHGGSLKSAVPIWTRSSRSVRRPRLVTARGFC